MTAKSWIAAGTMAMMVVLFVTYTWHKYPVGLIAVLGAMIVIITGYISDKEAYRSMDLKTIMVMAGSMGLAAGLENTGAGKIMADTVLGWLGSAATPFNVMAVMTLLATALTQIMSCTG